MSHREGDTRIAEAIRCLDESPLGAPPDLRALAACADLSQFHFLRLFRQDVGVSPKRYLQHLNAERARALLQQWQSVSTLSVACALRLSSTSRLHDLTVTVLGATPQELRAPLALRWGLHPSPWGEVLLACSQRGLCALSFLDAGGQDPHALLAEQWPYAKLVRDDDATRATHAQIFFAPVQENKQNILLHLHGTNLQVRVWAALLSIPPGYTTSYNALSEALALGGPRPVAAAVARNPIAGLIPCHRVLRASGALAGYRWGLARKAALLYHEARLNLR